MSARVALLVGSTVLASSCPACDQRVYVDPEPALRFVTFPSSPAELPANGRVAFAARGPAGAMPAEISFVQQRRDDGEALLFPTTFAGGVAPVDAVYVVEPRAVAAGDEVIIEPRAPDQSFGARSWTIAGVDDVTPPSLQDGPVVIADSRAVGTGDETELEVALVAQCALDGERYALRLSGDVAALLLPDTDFESVDGREHFLLRVPGGQRRRLCVAVAAIDVAGNETELADELCADIGP